MDVTDSLMPQKKTISVQYCEIVVAVQPIHGHSVVCERAPALTKNKTEIKYQRANDVNVCKNQLLQSLRLSGQRVYVAVAYSYLLHISDATDRIQLMNARLIVHENPIGNGAYATIDTTISIQH